MTRKEIKDLFERGVEDVVEIDFVEAAREGARRTRRRRMTLAGTSVVGLAAAGVVAVSVLGGLPDGGTTVPPAETSVGLTDGDAVPVGDPVLLVFSEADLRMVPGGIAEPATLDDLLDVTWRMQHLLPGPGTSGEPVGDPRFEPSSLATTLTFDGEAIEVDATCLRMSAPAEIGEGGRLGITGDWFVDPDPAPGAACVGTAEQWAQRAEAWQRLLAGGPLLSMSGRQLLLSGFTGTSTGDWSWVPVELTVERSEPAKQGQEPTGPWADASGLWVDPAHDPSEEQLRLGSGVSMRVVGGKAGGSFTVENACQRVGTGTTWLRTDGVLLSDATAQIPQAECTDAQSDALAQPDAGIALLQAMPRVSVDGDILTVEGWVQEDLAPEAESAPTTEASDEAGDDTLVFQRVGSVEPGAAPTIPPGEVAVPTSSLAGPRTS